jgi:hypothetical protein
MMETPVEFYFVIHNSDGDTTVEQLTKDELTERINDKYYGKVEFLGRIWKSDTNYWDDGLLIIKGNICVPTQAEVVLKYKLD